ncbi:unnamed protein product [Paramecium sonneborni]|uniref:Uncharacterized protein n=1 Tax=Paramecium sonneborni TaxID=65129 RepID=A0A8S1LQ58_9CILI|nr:unnamed protein product [Paramecium sonneborni]
MYNKKFFQLRQLTRNLDDCYHNDLETYNQIMGVVLKPNEKKLENDRQILKDWEIYKQRRLEYIINQTLKSPCFKICICNFVRNRKTSIEFWIRVAYDVFYDDSLGKEIRKKFWSKMKELSSTLESDLQQQQWPEEWKYLEYESCLNLQLIKLYEQYSAIRLFIAQKVNQYTTIQCDIGRMPLLKEEKKIRIDFSKSTWFPPIEINGPDLLESIFISDNYYCEQMAIFTLKMKDIIFPILDFFKKENENGKSVNIYGKKYEFILDVIYSLKSCCGPKINFTSGSLRMRKNFKCYNSYFVNEATCSVMLTTLQKEDITKDVLADIHLNSNVGYSAFVQTAYELQEIGQNERMKRLILIFSNEKLNFKEVKKKVIYYQLPDKEIQKLIDSLDYEFLQYYANLLFNKCMIVQQNCSSRKPFYQIMICMWTYVLCVYFQDELPTLVDNEVFNYVNQKLQQDFEIDLGLSPERENKIGRQIDQPQVIYHEIGETITVESDSNQDDDCIIIDKPQKYTKL